jgi:hypothetical protein
MATRSNFERLSQSCADIRVLIDYSDALQRIMDATSGDPSSVPTDLGKILKLTKTMKPLVNDKNDGLSVAILGLVLHSVVRSSSARGQMRDTINACKIWAPRHRIVADLIETIPERWRPTMAPVTGGIHLAALPAAERDELSAYLTRWRADHPAETRWLEEEAERIAAMS